MKNLLSRNLLPSVLLICLGLAATLFALVALTIARPQTQVNATMDVPSTPYIMTREGVFELSGNQPMIITATAEADQQVTLVVGRSKDIHAWLGEAPYTEVSGLQSWDKLHLEVSEGKIPEEEQPNPAKSDMWVEVIQAEGAVAYTTSEATKGMAVLATVDGKSPAPKLELAWSMASSLIWRVTLLVLGLLLTLVGAALLWVFKQKQVGSDAAAAEIAQGSLAGEIVGSSATLDGDFSDSEGATEPALEDSADLAEETLSEEILIEDDQTTDVEAAEDQTEEAQVEEALVETTSAPGKPGEETLSATEPTAEAVTGVVVAPSEEETIRAQAEPVHQRTHGDVIETKIGARSVRFPSRQAIKEARLRGESVIEIDGKTFQTGLIPVVKKVKDVAEADLEAE